MLDCSPRKIKEYNERYFPDNPNDGFWQLRTPLTGNRWCEGVPFGLDNGCFNLDNFNEKKWLKMIDEVREHKEFCKFVTLPDIVGDSQRTSELFDYFTHITNGVPRALVLQDGIQNTPIKWQWVTGGVFVGGSDSFKTSPYAINACKVARLLGKHVHVGRVNTIARALAYKGIAHSLDGSGISRFDFMLENVLSAIHDDNKQESLLEAV